MCRVLGLLGHMLGLARQTNLKQSLWSPSGTEQEEETSDIHLQLWTKKEVNISASGLLTGDSGGLSSMN